MKSGGPPRDDAPQRRNALGDNLSGKTRIPAWWASARLRGSKLRNSSVWLLNAKATCSNIKGGGVFPREAFIQARLVLKPLVQSISSAIRKIPWAKYQIQSSCPP